MPHTSSTCHPLCKQSKCHRGCFCGTLGMGNPMPCCNMPNAQSSGGWGNKHSGQRMTPRLAMGAAHLAACAAAASKPGNHANPPPANQLHNPHLQRLHTTIFGPRALAPMRQCLALGSAAHLGLWLRRHHNGCVWVKLHSPYAPAPLHTHTCVHATNPNAHTPNGPLEKNAGLAAVGTIKSFIRHDVNMWFCYHPC